MGQEFTNRITTVIGYFAKAISEQSPGTMEEIPQLNLPVVRVGGLSLLSMSANVLDVLLYHMYACLTSMAESSNCSWSIT